MSHWFTFDFYFSIKDYSRSWLWIIVSSCPPSQSTREKSSLLRSLLLWTNNSYLKKDDRQSYQAVFHRTKCGCDERCYWVEYVSNKRWNIHSFFLRCCLGRWDFEYWIKKIPISEIETKSYRDYKETYRMKGYWNGMNIIGMCCGIDSPQSVFSDIVSSFSLHCRLSVYWVTPFKSCRPSAVYEKKHSLSGTNSSTHVATI
jgi:hypothetical protein